MADSSQGETTAGSPEEPAVVRLSSGEIEAAQRLLSLLSSGIGGLLLQLPAQDSQTGYASGSERLQRRARDILANRRRRYDIFGRSMFGEPAWEMLLLLYVMQAGARQTFSRLAELAGTSKSTAMRWIDYLDTQRLIRRTTSTTDKRVVFVELTDKGSGAIEMYLSDTLAPID